MLVGDKTNRECCQCVRCCISAGNVLLQRCSSAKDWSRLSRPGRRWSDPTSHEQSRRRCIFPGYALACIRLSESCQQHAPSLFNISWGIFPFSLALCRESSSSSCPPFSVSLDSQDTGQSISTTLTDALVFYLFVWTALWIPKRPSSCYSCTRAQVVDHSFGPLRASPATKQYLLPRKSLRLHSGILN